MADEGERRDSARGGGVTDRGWAQNMEKRERAHGGTLEAKRPLTVFRLTPARTLTVSARREGFSDYTARRK